MSCSKDQHGTAEQPESAQPPDSSHLDSKDWRLTIGMFSEDELMKEIDSEGRRIREAEGAEEKSSAA
ncbi:MAG: hypothetical protein ACR2OZ_01035 [Verrucomicrobiales bacterium]